MELEVAAPGPVGGFFEVTALAYDKDACREAGALAGTAAEDGVEPLADDART